MKRKIGVRQFVQKFAEVHGKLKPGHSITIMKNGKPIGEFVRAVEKKVRLPDFEKDAKADGYGPTAGDRLVKRIAADEAIS